MSRLSRPLRHPRIAIAAALIAFVLAEALAVHLYLLNRRIGRELAGGAWREPSTILTRAGGREREVAKLHGAGWRVTPPLSLGSLPPHVPNAFLAAEDVRFRFHPGVDPIGILRALVTNVREGALAQGGSTISQQVIRARFLSQERTFRRKLTEVLLAIALDARLSKNEILEIYLNEVYLGHAGGRPVLGVDEASRFYFDKGADGLTVAEAATLASIVRAPNRDNPRKRPEIVRARRDAIVGVMRERGWIGRDEHDRAVRERIEFAGGNVPQMPYPFYLRAVRSELLKAIGARRLVEGGLRIVCEIDPKAQEAAERAARRAAARLEERYRWIRSEARNGPLEVAILSVDPRDGGIRALVGGANHERSSFDRTSSMRRQPGSAFKTFAYLAAISSRRVTTASLLLDAPVRVKIDGGDDWEPHNYDERYRGRVTVREAFEKSLNVPTVRLAQQVGIGSVAQTAEQIGFTRVPRVPALPLGVTEVSMRELTAAYTPFPTLGHRVEPFLIREVRGRDGKVLMKTEPQRKRVVDAASAYVVHTMLRGVVRRGTASRLARWGLGHVAGKTGTTNDYRDAWFVGYTADMVTSVWVGFDHGAPLRLSSAEAAIPVWGAYMSQVRHQPADPPRPAGVVVRDIDPETGMLWREGCPGPMREFFLEGTQPTRHCPSGFLGRIVRRVFFDREVFDEPPAITLEQFRRWTAEAERTRREMERTLDRLRRLFEE